MTQAFLAAAYSRRPAPKEYDPAWINVELARVAKSMPSYVIRRVTANTTLQINDGMVVGDATAGAFTITLPSPSLGSGQPVTIKKSDTSVNAITIGGTVDGVLNRTLSVQNDSIIIQSDGSTWFRPTLTASGSASAFTSITVTATSSTPNLITFPNTYSDASWTRNSVTVTSATVTSPVGTPTAALLTGGATDAYIAHAVPWTTNGLKEIAIYVSQGTLAQHELTIYDNTAAAFLGVLNIQWTAGVPAVSATSGTLTNLVAAPYPGGWYRCSCTMAGVLSAHSYSMLFYTNHRGAGSAGTVNVWGATAYDSPTASAATAVTVTGASYFYGPVTITGTITTSGLTASLPVFTNATNQLTTNAITGSGSVVMSASPTFTGTPVVPELRYTTSIWGSTALATPSAFGSTIGTLFTSTVSGATIMGYGTTGDVTLKNRAGTDAVIVTANTVNVQLKGTATVTGAFGCNGTTAQTAYASGGALAAYTTGAFGLDSDAHMNALYTLVVNMRAALVANGILS